MGSVSIPINSLPNSLGSYVADPGRSGTNETWAQIESGAGNNQQLGFASIVVRDDPINAGKYGVVTGGDLAINLQEYNLSTFTSATLRAVNAGITNENIWSTDERNGVVIVAQGETVRGTAKSAVNWDEIKSGWGTEYSARKAASALPLLTATTQVSFVLNATCLAYLNTVNSKANNPGWAFFGLAWTGMVDGETPTFSTDQHTFSWNNVGGDDWVLDLTFTTAVSINIGDSWKEVAGGYINTAGSDWKSISDVNINIGDVWKDLT